MRVEQESLLGPPARPTAIHETKLGTTKQKSTLKKTSSNSASRESVGDFEYCGRFCLRILLTSVSFS